MTQRSKVWLVVAVLFVVGNVVGAASAAATGELLHAGGHAALVLVGAYFVRRLWPREAAATAALPGDFADSLTRLEQSLDAVAIEVERIGEGQRFMTRLFTEGAAAPSGIKAREADAH